MTRKHVAMWLLPMSVQLSYPLHQGCNVKKFQEEVQNNFANKVIAIWGEVKTKR